MDLKSISEISELSKDYYLGRKGYEHHGCSLAIAKAFKFYLPAYHSLRRGGLTGETRCGAISAAELILGEIFGPEKPEEKISLKFLEIILYFRKQCQIKMPQSNHNNFICNNLVKKFNNFNSLSRFYFCGQIVQSTAIALARTIEKYGGKLRLPVEEEFANHDFLLNKAFKFYYPSIYIRSPEERLSWLNKGAEYLCRSEEKIKYFRLKTGLSCFSHSSQDLVTSKKQICSCIEERKIIKEICRKGVIVKCLLSPWADILVKMGYTYRELKIRYLTFMNFLKNKDLDKNFIFAVNDTPQPQQMIFSSGLFIESYKSMVGPGYEVALVRFNKEEIRKEIIKFDGVFNKKSTVYLNKKLTYNLKQREKLREELINILDNQYKYVDLQLKKSINDNIRKFKNVISSPSSKEKGKMIKNKGKIISSKIDDKIFFNNNVKKKFNKYLRYFTGKIKKKLKLDDVYFFIQQQVEGYEFYNPYDNQLRRLPIKNLFINLGHPLIKYFQKTRDILILEEISFFKEENFANLSNKSWLKICTLLKKYSFTVAAPIYYSDQIIGIIFLGKRIKNRLYTIEEINKLKKSINDSCSYLWEFLSYYWAVLSLKR